MSRILDKITVTMNRQSSVDSGSFYLKLYLADSNGEPTGGIITQSDVVDILTAMPTYADLHNVEFIFGDSINENTWYVAELIINGPVGNGQFNIFSMVGGWDEGEILRGKLSSYSPPTWDTYPSQNDDWPWSASVTIDSADIEDFLGHYLNYYTAYYSFYPERRFALAFYSGTGSSLPPKVIVTDPADEDADIKPHETTVTWVDPGGDIDHYNIYYGTLSGFLSKVGEVQDGETLEFQLRETNWPYYGQRHYFRIDTVNDVGTTAGDEIGFFIEIFKAPLPSGLIYTDGGDGTYTITGTPTGENNMMTIRKLAACARNTFFYEDI